MKNFELLISNFSYLKDGFKEANAKLTFWNQSRESFSKKLKFRIMVFLKSIHLRIKIKKIFNEKSWLDYD